FYHRWDSETGAGKGIEVQARHKEATANYRRNGSHELVFGYGTEALVGHDFNTRSTSFRLGPLDGEISRDRHGELNVDLNQQTFRPWLEDQIANYAQAQAEKFV